MDEIILKRTEQDYYVSTDEESSNDDDSEESQKISIVSHKIEKGLISFTIKNAESDSTQTLSTEDMDSPSYRKCVSDYIKKKAKKLLDKSKPKKQLKCIKGCTVVKKEIKYLVIYMDDHEETLSSFEMKQNYPEEMLKFLEKEVFNDN